MFESGGGGCVVLSLAVLIIGAVAGAVVVILVPALCMVVAVAGVLRRGVCAHTRIVVSALGLRVSPSSSETAQKHECSNEDICSDGIVMFDEVTREGENGND